MENYCKKFLIIMAVVGCTVLLSSCGKADNEYSEAIELMKSGKYEEAITHFESAIKENDEKAEYYIAYGMALNGTSHYNDAIKQFQKAYQDTDNKISRQNNKKLYFGEAVAYYGMSDYNKVIEACDEALAIDQYDDMNEKLGRMKAAANEFMGNFDNALETYGELLKDNKLSNIYIARAGLYERLGDIKKAAADYESAIDVDKNCYDAHFALYNIYKNDDGKIFKDGNKRANDIITKITDAKMKSAEELMQLGRAYYYIGDYSSAESNLEQSLKDGCDEALYYLGEVKMSDSDYKEAVNKFDEYIHKVGETNINGTNIPQAYNQIAGCYIMLGDYKNAESYIEAGTALGPTTAGRMLSRNRVILYEKTLKYKKARKAAKQYLAEFPCDEDMKKELSFINTRIKTVSLSREAASTIE